jgi:glycerol-3-phosphate cytidylyltransferase
MDFKSISAVCEQIRNNAQDSRLFQRIGFTCSSFDLLHSGHYLMLEDCKENCDVLIIGLHDDPTLDEDYRIKTGGKNKNIPVQTYEERLIQISGVKHVDHVVRYSTESELLELLQLVSPDVRFIGEDWRGKEFTGHELDIEIHFNPRSHTYSTSGLRRRVYEAEKAKLE